MEKKKRAGTKAFKSGEQNGKKPRRNRSKYYAKKRSRETFGQNVSKSNVETKEGTLGQNIQKPDVEMRKNTLGQNVQKFNVETKERTFGQNVLKSGVETKEGTFGQNVLKSDVEIKEKERKARNKTRVRKEAEKRRNKEEAVFKETGNVTFAEHNYDTLTENNSRAVLHHKNPTFPGNEVVSENSSRTFREKRTIGFNDVDRSEKKETDVRKTKKRKKEISQSTEYTLEQVFDPNIGRTRYVAVPVKRKRMFAPDAAMKATMRKMEYVSRDFIREQTADEEDDNAATEGGYQILNSADRIFAFTKRNYGSSKRDGKQNHIFPWEKEEIGRKRKQKLSREKEQKKALQKRVQKQRIKRTYTKAIRQAVADRNLQEVVLQTRQLTVMAARQIQEAVRKHAGVLAVAGTSLLLLVMIMTSVSSCGTMFADMQSTILAAAYQSESGEIDATDLQFTRLELDLQNEIDAIETNHPGYDEYAYNLGEIGHNPFTLISYLSAVHTEFRASTVEQEVESLFEEMYELTLEPTTEIRTREVQAENEAGELLFDEDGNPVMEEEEYEVSILKVTLTVTPLETIVDGKMDVEQKEFYEMYRETGGLLQEFDTPVRLYWYQYVSSYYGYRKNPITGEEQFHRGVDIAVPTGTRVYATHDGVVVEAAYDSHYGNYVVMEREGYVTKYAHMDTLNVSVGQSIEKGEVIGTTGNTGSSTGSHLHIECMFNGEYYNPLFYFEAGTGTIYGEAIDRDPTDVVPPEAYDDEVIQVLMEEAARYLGYPYVYGGSEPSSGFDCSGFVCFVFTNSGVRELPRTNVRGIYSQCTEVSPSEAKAGDLIFFTGTYGIPGLPSHVGIYCGDGVMIHCGDPIAYASITSSYWQSHFYGFGRLN